MDVTPSSIIIPPHEYRCCTLLFSPTAIQQYSATFTAEVEGGSDSKTKAFSCELRGEGSLPSLTMQVCVTDAPFTLQPCLLCNLYINEHYALSMMVGQPGNHGTLTKR